MFLYETAVNLIEDTVGGILRELLQQVRKYSTYRPHHYLKGLSSRGVSW
jgi:hypothetical protein